MTTSKNPMQSAAKDGIVLFMGMVRRGEFESLQKRGIPLGILVDTNNKARMGDVSGFACVEQFDFSRPLSELIESVRDIQARHGIRSLYNVIEFYVSQTAEVSKALGLPGITPESAALCLDKDVMRRRFRERIGPHSAARFSSIQNEPELLSSAKSLGFPCFLQPANVSASMWATRNTDERVLLANYRAMIDEVPAYYQKLGKAGTPLNIVLSEYLEGRNVSIDCLADSQGRVYTTPPVEVLTGNDVGIDDYHHFARLLPPVMSEDLAAQLTGLAIAGVQALDISSSAAHVEFIGSRLGEIAARPGGNRARILEMAYGIDLLHAYYQVLCGLEPNLRGDRKLAAAIVTPFAPRTGVLQSIGYLDSIAALRSYSYHEIRAQPGQQLGLSKEGYRAGLYIELLSNDPQTVREDIEEIASWADLYQLA